MSKEERQQVNATARSAAKAFPRHKLWTLERETLFIAAYERGVLYWQRQIAAAEKERSRSR